MAVNLSAGTFYDHEAGEGGGVVDLVMRRRHTDKQGAIAWLRERGHLPKPAGLNIVARYPYTDAAGELLFEVVRLDPKDFRQPIDEVVRPSRPYGRRPPWSTLSASPISRTWMERYRVILPISEPMDRALLPAVEMVAEHLGLLTRSLDR